MALQTLSLGLLGMSGYAVFRRSQTVQANSDNAPVHPDQEQSARNYVVTIINNNVNALGVELGSAITATNWVNSDQKDIGNNTAINFASTYPSITYSQLVLMNGLALMQLVNLARVDPDSSKVLFDLDTRRVLVPLSAKAITAIGQMKAKLGV